MDARSGLGPGDSLAVTGWGSICVPTQAAGLGGEVSQWLKSQKMRKYMGKQDELGVIAAGRAMRTAGIAGGFDPERIGLYLCVGYIPFERTEIDMLTASSIRAGRFSMALFATEGIEQVNPLLTFRCLPNMPIFHVSLNFGITGPYFVTYPGIGQFYLALERAVCALQTGEIDHALVGGVADQNNFLVQYHFARQADPAARARPDVGAVLCLERRSSAAARGAVIRAELLGLEIRYQNHDPLKLTVADRCEDDLGPAALACLLQSAASGPFVHASTTRDGFRVQSRWIVP